MFNDYEPIKRGLLTGKEGDAVVYPMWGLYTNLADTMDDKLEHIIDYFRYQPTNAWKSYFEAQPLAVKLAEKYNIPKQDEPYKIQNYQKLVEKKSLLDEMKVSK